MVVLLRNRLRNQVKLPRKGPRSPDPDISERPRQRNEREADSKRHPPPRGFFDKAGTGVALLPLALLSLSVLSWPLVLGESEPCRFRYHVDADIYSSPPSTWHGSLTIEILHNLRFASPAVSKKFPRKIRLAAQHLDSMALSDPGSFVAFGIDFGTT